MKRDILKNNANPFTVPDGYFDSLQARIMSRIQAEEIHEKDRGRILRMNPYRWAMIAAAACILFVFTGAAIYLAYTDKQPAVAEMVIDEDFYQWFLASDGATLMAASLDIPVPENLIAGDTKYSEEDEAIIRFLERENINVMAIVHSMNYELSYTP